MSEQVKIPIRTIWLLLVYASDVYKELSADFLNSRVNLDERIDDIVDLLAKILCGHVESKLRRNLGMGYRHTSEQLSYVRGRIEVYETLTRKLLDKGMVQCRFSTLSIDVLRNRYVKSALVKLSSLPSSWYQDEKRREQCYLLSVYMSRLGVSNTIPTTYSALDERYAFRDRGERRMMMAAHFVHQLAIPYSKEGEECYYSSSLIRKDTWLHRLFEKAIRNFYKYRFEMKNPQCWEVGAKKVRWRYDENSSSSKISTFLPTMKTDISIINRKTNKTLIIDAKYTNILGKDTRNHEKKSAQKFHPAHMYQIFSYIKNQRYAGTVSGLLLYPVAGGQHIDEQMYYDNYSIGFKTIDLTLTAREITDRLHGIVDSVFDA